MHAHSRPCLLLAAFLMLVVGCNPPQFHATTVVRSDGSCERTIIQPREGYLPRVARPPGAAPDSTDLSPDWMAEWTSVTGAERPPKKAPDNAPLGKYEYFTAHGTFKSPAEIPLHYLYANKATPESGLSALTREFERTDFGLFVEYRWKETVTNSVTRERFLDGIAGLLQIFGPYVTSGLPDALGDAYDAAPLIRFLQDEAPAGIKELATTFYDARLHHLGEDATKRELIEVLRRRGFGWDEKAKDPFGKLVEETVQKYVRRTDNKPMTKEDVATISKLLNEFDWKSHGEKLGFEEDPFVHALDSAFGIYPLISVLGDAESFDYSLELPGTIIETNGRLRTPNQTYWKFSAGDTFPSGYEMMARSILYNRDAQEKLCGKVVVGDGRSVEEFIKLVGRDGPLLKAVREACKEGKFDPIQNLRANDKLSASQISTAREFLRSGR
ncbi:MAG TPA: hypothetical protein VHD36_20755 [Pirellulales bacterium]|nr:hypothetical protein [Pirellulales bacterium]